MSKQLELRGDLNRASEAARDGTEPGVESVDSLRVSSTVLRDRQPIVDLDPLDDQHTVFGLDLTDGLDFVPTWINSDLTRLQRACERAGQSTACGRDDVVERRCVRRILLWPDAIVLRNLRMHSEGHGVILGGQIREPLRATKPFDSHPRNVGDVSHLRSVYSG
jgi:hypothetical protein